MAVESWWKMTIIYLPLCPWCSNEWDRPCYQCSAQSVVRWIPRTYHMCNLCTLAQLGRGTSATLKVASNILMSIIPLLHQQNILGYCWVDQCKWLPKNNLGPLTPQTDLGWTQVDPGSCGSGNGRDPGCLTWVALKGDDWCFLCPFVSHLCQPFTKSIFNDIHRVQQG